MKRTSLPLPGRAPRLLLTAAAAILLITAHFLLFQFQTAQAQGDIIYVNSAASGEATGSSWEDAFIILQDALAAAEDGDEIWVAAGIYTPGASPSDSFHIPPGVSLYGGFAGTEDELEERDWEAHPTVLSGDIDGNDKVDGRGVVTDTANIKGDNAYHVVWLDGSTTSSTRLDGVIITAGQADSDFPNDVGGGLYCRGTGDGNVCSPTLTNVAFAGNSAARYGGAMYNAGYLKGESSPTLTNVTFSGNSANYGGAMFNDGQDGESSPSLTNVTFSGNAATYGGAMVNHGGFNGENNPTLTNVTFSGNQADYGGAMYNNGVNGESNPTLTNVTFAGNSASGNGGAMHNLGVCSPTLTNVILWDNSAGVSGAVMFNSGATPTIAHSLVQGGLNGGIVNVANGSVTDGGGNINDDPLFMTPVNPADAPTTAGDLRLRPGSPAIDAGDNGVLPPGLTTDLAGGPRIMGGTVDMGAYEYMTRLYVDGDASGANNGSSWSDAFTTLQDALRLAYEGSEIWVAAGIYTPGASPSDSFHIPPGVSLYGGFAGTEDELEERDWEAYPTVLSGDIDGNDTTDERGVVTDVENIEGLNAYHVVWLDGSTKSITASTRLEGITITAGQANGIIPDNAGGGLYCNGGGPGSVCSPSLTNVTFSGNAATWGGALFNDGSYSGESSPTLINVTFAGNWADSGGAMYNYGTNGASNPMLVNVTFAGNQADNWGGAMFNYALNGESSPTLTNVTFSGNQAGVSGGAVYNFGAQGGESSPTLTNVTFSGNSAVQEGGAMYNHGLLGQSNPRLTNVILWGNSAGSSGDVMYNDGAIPTIAYSLVQGGLDGPGIGGNSVTDGDHNIDADPLFLTPINPADAPTTAGDLRLRSGSPAINAGNNSALPPDLTTDLAGGPRIIGGAVDMGAYEFMARLYVDEDATGENNGSSWDDAFTTLQDALFLAYDGSEIWVAEGVYYPDEGRGQTEDDRHSTFNIPPGVSLYGGFAGGEEELEERNWEENPTVLSGDIGGDDDTDEHGVVTDTANIKNDNAYHVVWLDGTTTPITASTRIDGVIITAGQADDVIFPDNSGGGLYCAGSGAGSVCSPTLTNVAFSGNQADYGGAMVNEGDQGGQSSPTLTNVAFSGNQADYGGAMYNIGFNGGQSSPTLTNVAFSGNRADYGGAIYNDGYNGGASSPMLTNVTFSGNQADYYGGAIYNDGRSGQSNPTLTNVILWGNSASNSGGVMRNIAATLTIAHSLVQGGLNGSGMANDTSSVVIDGGGNIDADPLFITPINPDDAPTTAGDLRLRPGSPAIDAGDNGVLPASLTTDLDGNPRIAGSTVDIGAYEFQFQCDIVDSRVYVDSDASGAGDGSSWDDALTSLRHALLTAAACDDVDEIWVAEGVYTPGISRSDSFHIPPGVSLYGGFAGGEEELEERNWEENPTVLSGDIGRDDDTDERGVVTDVDNIEGLNAYHVVWLDGTTTPITTSTRLDGVIITAGQANGGDVPDDVGGGLYCNGGGPGSMCSPSLTNVTFSGNGASSYGGAMYNAGHSEGESSPTLTNVTFSGNSATSHGGAMYNSGSNSGQSSPTLTNVTFAGNRAEYGGAMANVGLDGISSPTLTNVTFAGNRAGNDGGAMHNNGLHGVSSPTLTNVTFAGNRAENNGGAMSNAGFLGTNSPTLTNVILWDNSAGNSGAVMYNLSATPTIAHSLVEGGLNSGIGGDPVTDGGDNISADPLFMTPVKPADAPTTAGDLRLLPGSPAIDAGSNNALPPGLMTDLDGNLRIQGGVVDMGAYEYTPALLTVEMAPASVLEDSGQALTVTFTRTQNSVGELVVAFDVGGTATFGADYTQSGASSFDSSSGTVTLGDGALTHTLLLTPTADFIAEPDETVTLTLVADEFYEVGTAATVTGTILNDDTASVLVSPTTGLITTEAGGTASFTVTLQSEPASTVTVTLASSDATEGTVSPAALTFDAGNWQTAQMVTVTGVDDDEDDGDVTYTIELAVSSDDPLYDGFTTPFVTVTNLDDDDPPPVEYWAFLPLLSGPPPAPAGLPDLVVQELAASSDGVTVVIANVGGSAVVDPFWVDVYIDPNPVPAAANQIWQMLSEEGLAWGIGDDALPLQPGASLTLTVGDDYFMPDASNFSGAMAAGTVLYAQVDSAHSDTDYGAVLEAHEVDHSAYNNVAGPVLTPGALIMSWPQAVSPSASGLLPPR